MSGLEEIKALARARVAELDEAIGRLQSELVPLVGERQELLNLTGQSPEKPYIHRSIEDALRAAGRPMSASELSEATGKALSTIYALLSPSRANGAVVKIAGNRYRLEVQP